MLEVRDPPVICLEPKNTHSVTLFPSGGLMKIMRASHLPGGVVQSE